MVWIRTRRRRWVSSARRSRVAGSGTQTVGNRSCRSKSRVPSIPFIGLRFADDHGANLGGIADEHGVPEAVHEGMEPDGVAGALNAHRDGPGQGGVELFDGVAFVDQLPLIRFARLGIEYCHVLLPRVEITANECHESGLLSEGVVTVPPPEHTNSRRPFS